MRGRIPPQAPLLHRQGLLLSCACCHQRRSWRSRSMRRIRKQTRTSKPSIKCFTSIDRLMVRIHPATTKSSLPRCWARMLLERFSFLQIARAFRTARSWTDGALRCGFTPSRHTPWKFAPQDLIRTSSMRMTSLSNLANEPDFGLPGSHRPMVIVALPGELIIGAGGATKFGPMPGTCPSPTPTRKLCPRLKLPLI